MTIDQDAPLASRPERHAPTYDERFEARLDYYLDARHLDAATARKKALEDVGPDPAAEAEEVEVAEAISDEDKNRLLGKLGVEADLSFIARKMADGLSFVDANALMLAHREHKKRNY